MLQNEVPLKKTPWTTHTECLEIFHNFFDIKDDIENAFIQQNNQRISELEVKYLASRHHLCCHITWLDNLIKQTSYPDTEWSELLDEMKIWSLKMSNYYEILKCYQISLQRHNQ